MLIRRWSSGGVVLSLEFPPNIPPFFCRASILNQHLDDHDQEVVQQRGSGEERSSILSCRLLLEINQLLDPALWYYSASLDLFLFCFHLNPAPWSLGIILHLCIFNFFIFSYASSSTLYPCE